MLRESGLPCFIYERTTTANLVLELCRLRSALDRFYNLRWGCARETTRKERSAEFNLYMCVYTRDFASNADQSSNRICRFASFSSLSLLLGTLFVVWNFYFVPAVSLNFNTLRVRHNICSIIYLTKRFFFLL